MTQSKKIIFVLLLLPSLWSCDKHSTSSNNVATTPLTVGEEALVDLISTNMDNDNYMSAVNDLSDLMGLYPENTQLADLYGRAFALRAGFSPVDFAIQVGAQPTEVADEDGNMQTVQISQSLIKSLVALANIQGDESDQRRLSEGRAAIYWSTRDKNLLQLSEQERANIGVMAAIHTTRLVYLLIDGTLDNLTDRDAVAATVENIPPTEKVELTAMLNILSLTFDDTHKAYPIKEFTESPLLLPAADNTFAYLMSDDNELSNTEITDTLSLILGY